MEQKMQKLQTNIRLGFGRQIGFGLGEFAGQFFFSFWSSYLSVYYTDIVGIAPAVVSAIFMIARIWDAVNDPVFGNIADRHRHKKFGRYRPWILFGTPILAILSILMFHVPDAAPNEMKIIYITITYILAGMAFTAVNIPYMSMQSTLTTNPQSRMNISAMKSAFTCVGTVVLNLVAMPCILKFGNGQQTGNAYFFTAILFTVFGVILYYITFASTKEVYYPEQQQTHVGLKGTFQYIFGNKYLLIVMFGLLFSMLSMFTRIGIAVYYYIYCMQQPTMGGIFMVIPPLVGILPTYLLPKLKISKKILVIIALLGQAASLFVIFALDYTNMKAIVIWLIIYGFFSYQHGIVFGMVAPAIDDAEVKKNIRLDGTAFAFANLFNKVASAVGPAVGLLIMGALGYIANAQQTAGALRGINIATNIVPAVFALVGVIPFLLYNLNDDKIAENSRILAERHGVQKAEEE